MRLRWLLALGAWGDTLAAIGHGLAWLRATGQEQVGMIHYGSDPHINRFAVAQPWCREAIQIAPAGRGDYLRTISRATHDPRKVEAWLTRLMVGTGIDPATVRPCHPERHSPVERWTGAALPASVREWATERVADLPRPLWLLQPISTQSTCIEGHWPHWRPAAAWLAATVPGTVVVIGSDPYAHRFGRLPGVVDLVGQLPSMLHVLALAEQCDRLVTTCNGLALWSAMQGIPAVVASNTAIKSPTSYYARWIDTPPNQLLPLRAGLPEFQAAVSELL